MGDGVTDDGPAFRAAMESAERYDGIGVVEVPEGYTFSLSEKEYGQYDSVYQFTRGRVTLTGGGTITTNADYFLFGLTDTDAHTAWDIDPASADDTTVTTTSASDLEAGDKVLVYTGNTAANNGALGAPDSELNEVVSVAGTTVTLLRPLAKDYVQEFYDVGEDATTGTTSPSKLGDAAPLGIRKIDTFDDVTVNGGLTINHTGTNAVFGGGVWDGLHFGDLNIDTTGDVISISTWRGSYGNITAHTSKTHGKWFAVAFGACDVDVWGTNELTADTIGYFHIHEGASRISTEGATTTIVNGGYSGDDQAVVGLRGRAYDVTLDGFDITNASTGTGGVYVRVDSGVTGTASNMTYQGTSAGTVANNSGGTFTFA